MIHTIYEIPVSLESGEPSFRERMRRKCEIVFEYYDAPDGSASQLAPKKELILSFEGVEAYKSTFLSSLGSLDQTILNLAYGKVISTDDSQWLAKSVEAYYRFYERSTTPPKPLRHMMILFDDGPFYEFICQGFVPPLLMRGQ